MHSATCAECHKPCEVPFRPNGDKPVYCNNCFGSKRDSSPRDFAPKRDFAPRRDFSSAPQGKPAFDNSRADENKKQFETLNAKLDKLIELLGKNITPTAPVKAEIKSEKATVSPKKEVVAKKKAVSKKK
ncbi:MAG: CxxC-x17-CxxC domain-containing protein [bacterium]